MAYIDKYGVEFSDDSKTIVKCPKDFQGEYIIPNSVTSIGDSAFDDCKGLTSIEIPNSVTSIGKLAFYGCSGLTSVTIPNSVTSIGDEAFYWCYGLTSISIPNSVTSIGDEAFRHCSGLTAVTIPNSVTSIGERAFSGCRGLTGVSIPNSVTSIGERAFYNVPNIVYNGSATGSPWGARSLNGYVDGWLVYSDDSKTILLACFSSAIGEITIPNSVTSIGTRAFVGCEGLTSVTIPNSVTSIGERAFSGCRGLTGVSIPNSVTSIGDEAFYECSSLKEIYVPVGEEERFCKMPGLKLKYLAKIIHLTSEKQKEQLRQLEHEAQEQQRLQAQQLQEMLQDAILFFDTETTGVPRNYKAPVSDSANWPRLVQLAWLMADQNGNILKRKSAIIKPDGFSIPSDASAVHGITTERAQREGQPLDAVLEEFMDDVQFAANVVGHNIDFDMHIVGAELYRLDKDYDLLMDKPCTCTMKSSTDFCAIPNPNSYYGGYKWPSLQELYRKLFNSDFADAHDALADITATKECFFELKRRGII